MVSEQAKEYLRSIYGDHDYSYEMSDTNLRSVIKNHKPKNFVELDHWARDLEAVIKDIKRMQGEME